MVKANNQNKIGIAFTVFIFGIIAMYISRMLIIYVLPSLSTTWVLVGSIALSVWIVYLGLSQIEIEY